MKLNLSELDLLITPQELFKYRYRVKCPKCGNSGQYFCRICRCSLISEYKGLCCQNGQNEQNQILNQQTEQLGSKNTISEQSACKNFELPQITLSIPVTILYSRKEKLEKSSIQYLFPLQINNLKIADIEEFIEFPENSVLLMPHKDAVPIQKINWNEINQTFLLDCKWNQCFSILQQFQTKKITFAQLSGYESSFWRPSCMKIIGCLSTIECLYFLLKEIENILQVKTDHLDGILTFYVNNICIVKQTLHKQGKLELRRNKGEIYDNWIQVKEALELKYGPFPED